MRAHPGASRERVHWDGSELHVWIGARAVDGQANEALVRAVARRLGVRRSAVQLVAGSRGRSKVLDVEGLEPSRLGELGGPAGERS